MAKSYRAYVDKFDNELGQIQFVSFFNTIKEANEWIGGFHHVRESEIAEVEAEQQQEKEWSFDDEDIII